MRRINIASPRFEYDGEDPEGFRAGIVRLGKLLGAEESGISVYEIPPGQSICPYHYEVGEEEWLLVLEGTPTLRHPEGSERLDPWDIACFPRGPEGAHGVGNETGRTVRVLMFSTVVVPTATVYPDSDKVGIWTGNPADDVMARKESGVGYYDGEV
ncbi:MAG: Cupin 2 conserved barrel domain protein [Solirubrobacterales bacterium]|nr:Cupin 2 conserved barrel domain protein [Solirubrobacterales bacterium]